MDHSRINDLASNSTFEALYNEIKPIRDHYTRLYQKNFSNILDASDIEAVIDDKLMAAYKNYDVSKGNFLSFIYIYWKGGISDLLKCKKSSKNDVARIIFADINDMADIPNKVDVLDSILSDISVNQLLNELNDRDVILIRCLVAGESYRSIAQKHCELFSSYKAVERAVKRIREQLKYA